MKLLHINNTNVLFNKVKSGMANIRFDTNVGSCSEKPKEYGISHFLEHMMFKGTPKRTAKEINKDAERIGGELNAGTSYDYTTYYITALTENFENSFELLADMFLNPLFPKYELEKERTVVLDEIHRSKEDPMNVLEDNLSGKAWSHNIDHPILGLEENIKSITIKELKNWRDKYYSGKNIQIAIAGDLKEKLIKSVIKRYFQNSGNSSDIIYPKLTFTEGKEDFSKEGLVEAHYKRFYPSLSQSHPDYIKQAIMTTVLGGSSSALLFEKIREEMGLVYGIYSYLRNNTPFNNLIIRTSANPKNIDLIDKTIEELINKISSELISEDRLMIAKSSLLSRLRALSESSAGINRMNSMAYLKGYSQNMYKRLNTEIPLVTVEDVLDIAQKTFSVKPYIGILWPK